MIRDFFNWGPPSKKDENAIQYADFSARLMASTIDAVLSFFLIAPIMAILAKLIYGDMDLNALLEEARNTGSFTGMMQVLNQSNFWPLWLANNLIQFAVLSVIVLAFWFRLSATPGKVLLRMQIVDEKTLGEPTRFQYVVRYLGYIVSSLPFFLGFMWVGFDKKKQGWHDKMAGTVVIFRPKRKKKDASSADQSADPSDSPAPASRE